MRLMRQVKPTRLHVIDWHRILLFVQRSVKVCVSFLEQSSLGFLFFDHIFWRQSGRGYRIAVSVPSS